MDDPLPRVTICCGLLSFLPLTVTLHMYSPASLSLTVTITLVTSSVSGSDALTESMSPFCANSALRTSREMVVRDSFRAMPFLVHSTTVGGPYEELNERVKTGGSAVGMRANWLVSTTGPAAWWFNYMI